MIPITSIVLASSACALAIGLLITYILCRKSLDSRRCNISIYVIIACIIIATLLTLICNVLAKQSPGSLSIKKSDVTDKVITIPTSTATPAAEAAGVQQSVPLSINVSDGTPLPSGNLVTLNIDADSNVFGELCSMSLLKYEGFRIHSINAFSNDSAGNSTFFTFSTNDVAALGQRLMMSYNLDPGHIAQEGASLRYHLHPIVWVGFNEYSIKAPDWQRDKYDAYNFDRNYSISSITLSKDEFATAYLIQPLPSKQIL